MKSRWFKLKPKAIAYRKKGKSIKWIEKTLGIPRSTLSGWLKDIKLTQSQRMSLHRKWKLALGIARQKAVKWHNKGKLDRLKKAENEANQTLSNIDTSNREILELALALLYIGEGFKTDETGMGNSDPMILKFFMAAVMRLYNLQISDIRCELHLRADQNELKVMKYWSEVLKVPTTNFYKASFDKRTIGRPTYPHYKGVCIVRFGNVAIQRKLVYLSRQFCEKIIKSKGD